MVWQGLCYHGFHTDSTDIISSGSPRSAHVIINVAGPYMLAEGEVDVQNVGTTFDIIMLVSISVYPKNFPRYPK